MGSKYDTDKECSAKVLWWERNTCLGKFQTLLKGVMELTPTQSTELHNIADKLKVARDPEAGIIFATEMLPR